MKAPTNDDGGKQWPVMARWHRKGGWSMVLVVLESQLQSNAAVSDNRRSS